MRADAKRNYDRIVEVAHAVFKDKGYDAPLDEIARKAGVGAGTLYRHFPTREDLIDGVMRAWVERVEEATDKALAHEGSDRELLVGWFTTYVDLLLARKGGAARMTAAIGDPSSPIRTKCQALVDANGRVLDVLEERGALRPGVDAVQVSRLLGGVGTVADQSELTREAVAPMLEVVADGLLA